MNDLDRLTHQRGYRVVVGALLCAAVVGFFAGTRNDAHAPTGYGTQELPEAQGLARSYAELRARPQHANQELYTASLAVLQRALPQPTGAVTRPPGSREDALSTRTALRAYDGAPPVIPHVIDQRAQPNCAACHEHGAMIGEKVAPAMSHPMMPNCIQCHAPRLAPSGLRAVTLADVENAFEPTSPGGLGVRAWPGAPPVMPHSTWMRDRCSSCHGVTGKPGIRTTHPDRQNCQQCHASQASADQRLPFTFAHQENQ